MTKWLTAVTGESVPAKGLLCQLTDNDIDWLVRAGTRRKLAAGSVLVSAGHDPGAIFIVLRGTINVTANGVEVSELDSGCMAGEISFLTGSPATATLVARTDSEVFELPAVALAERIAAEAPGATRWSRILGGFASARLRRYVLNGPDPRGQLSATDSRRLDAIIDRLSRA